MKVKKVNNKNVKKTKQPKREVHHATLPREVHYATMPVKNQRLVALRNVDRMKEEGWKIVMGDIKDKHGRIMSAKVDVSDLVLMEK